MMLFNLQEIRRIEPNLSKLTCTACGLCSGGIYTRKMKPWGECKQGLMCIGEAPGEVEDKRGQPWQGKAGTRLSNELDRLGIDLELDCVSLNSANCRPPKNRAPTDHEVSCCRVQVVSPTIHKYRPHTIILLGGSAILSVIGQRWKKDLGAVSRWRGFNIPDQELKAWICPVFHPSYVEREDKREEVQTIWRQDLKRALETLDKELPEPPNQQITTLDQDDEIVSTLNGIISGNEGSLCAFDYETTGLKPHAQGHKVVCASVATARKTYVFMGPRSENVKKAWCQFLRSPIKKVSHHMKFEDIWSKVLFDTEVMNWHWDSMLATHVLDHRSGITGLKFQVYVNFGISGYDDAIAPYLEGSDKKNANSFNKIDQAIKDLGEKAVLTYCGLDSLFCRELALRQIKLVV